jgi:hypothetical protein
MPNLVDRFIYSRDLVSLLIGWETNSLWIHTERKNRAGDKWVGAHAITGVQARPLDWAGKLEREAIYSRSVTDAQYEAAMSFQESKIGAPYGYLDIVGLAIHKRIGLSDHEIICSAFSIMCDQAAGIYPLNCEPEFDALITPETYHLSSHFIGNRIECAPKSG